VSNATPYLILGINGVLNPAQRNPGFDSTPFRTVATQREYVHYSKHHQEFLKFIADNKMAELVWATSWCHDPQALDWFEKLMGLESLPVIDVPLHDPPAGNFSLKLNPIIAYIGDRPAIWVEDCVGGRELRWAERRTKEGIRTAVVPLNEWTGLSREGMSAVLGWLHEGARDSA
jgi:hypothetical protein